MKVCIAGGGRVGRYLAQSLLANHHEIVIIEPVESQCRMLADMLDIPVICGDSVASLGAQRQKFDIIFLDPPYGSGLLEQAMEKIASFDILSPHGIMVAESALDQALPALPAPYSLYREYRYGKIKVTIYHRAGEEEA